MIIRLKALDTLFFRDGKPFTRGESCWAVGNFPPLPSVIYGALRSACFADDIKSFVHVNTDSDTTAGLKIKGVYLAVDDIPCLPLPLDCVRIKDSEEDEAFLLKIFKAPVASSCRTSHILRSEDVIEVENAEQAFIDVDSFNNYLTLNENMSDDNMAVASLLLNYMKLSDYLITEPKLGIALDKNSRSAKDHMLYRVGMLRPESKLYRAWAPWE